jgi:long-chain fatty acid transport protein
MKSIAFPSSPTSLRLIAGSLGLILLAAVQPSWASGTRVGFKDAFAMARGNAFVATADNPSAVYYNPAGLTQLSGQRLSASVYDVSVQSDYHNATSSASLDDSYQAVPEIY